MIHHILSYVSPFGILRPITDGDPFYMSNMFANSVKNMNISFQSNKSFSDYFELQFPVFSLIETKFVFFN